MSSSSESHDYYGLMDALEQKIAQLSRLRQENDDLRRKVERADADNARLRADQERLDWLEQVNLRMNERNGSVYGWKYDINHNRAALTDCNLPALAIREAIDSARFPDKAAEIRCASSKEGARLKAFDERFPGLRERVRAALEQKQ